MVIGDVMGKEGDSDFDFGSGGFCIPFSFGECLLMGQIG